MSTQDQRDEAYYWDTVIFSVEGVLFKVPRYQFESKSEIFKDMFALPSGQKNAEGDSDKNPIKLEGIKVEEFRPLLKVLYPTSYCDSFRPQVDIDVTHEEWKFVLKLAHLWRFLEIRAVAIRKLSIECELMQPCERIVLGRKYFIADWVKYGYIDLVKQKLVPVIEDIDVIGYATGIRIFRLREEVRRDARELFLGASLYNRGQSRCHDCNTRDETYAFCRGCMVKRIDLSGNEIESVIDKEFHAELEQIEEGSRPYKYAFANASSQTTDSCQHQ